MTSRFLMILAAVALPVFAMAQEQGTQVAFGIQQDTDAPVEVTSDTLSVDQDTGRAVFTGRVVIVQGEMRLAAPRVEVLYAEKQGEIREMQATGGVTLVSGPDAAESQRADYDVENGVIVMTGDVLMTQGASAVVSDRATINLDTGMARMVGRVRTVLQKASE